MMADKTVCILNLNMAWNSSVLICWIFLNFISFYNKLLVAFTRMVQFSGFFDTWIFF